MSLWSSRPLLFHFARAFLHGDVSERALGARSPLNSLRATVGVQCGQRFFMPCFNSLWEHILGFGSFRLQRKWKALISSISHRGKSSPLHFQCSLLSHFLPWRQLEPFLLLPLAFRHPSWRWCSCSNCAYNLALEFEPRSHISCTTCMLTLCRCLTNLLDIQPLRLHWCLRNLVAPLLKWHARKISVHLYVNSTCRTCTHSILPCILQIPFLLIAIQIARVRKKLLPYVTPRLDSPLWWWCNSWSSRRENDLLFLSLRACLARARLPACSMQFSHPWRRTANASWFYL